MADKSGIVWTEATWNPIAGCSEVDEDCRNCYAKTTVERMALNPTYGARYAGLTRPGPNNRTLWTGRVALMPTLMDRPLKWSTPRRIFVNSLSDLFHPDVPAEWIDQVFATMAAAPRHTYQLLTKRPAALAAFMNGDGEARTIEALARHYGLKPGGTGYAWEWPPRWLHGGTSVGHQEAVVRAHELLTARLSTRFLSCGPLIGPTPLSDVLAGIDWVIVEGESGPDARPMHPDWARTIRDECAAADVPFLFKQWGEYHPDKWLKAPPWRVQYQHVDGHLVDITNVRPAENPLYQDVPGVIAMYRVGKHAAGRELDGVVHDAYPRTDEIQPALLRQ